MTATRDALDSTPDRSLPERGVRRLDRAHLLAAGLFLFAAVYVWGQG